MTQNNMTATEVDILESVSTRPVDFDIRWDNGQSYLYAETEKAKKWRKDNPEETLTFPLDDFENTVETLKKLWCAGLSIGHRPLGGTDAKT